MVRRGHIVIKFFPGSKGQRTDGCPAKAPKGFSECGMSVLSFHMNVSTIAPNFSVLSLNRSRLVSQDGNKSYGLQIHNNCPDCPKDSHLMQFIEIIRIGILKMLAEIAQRMLNGAPTLRGQQPVKLVLNTNPAKARSETMGTQQIMQRT